MHPKLLRNFYLLAILLGSTTVNAQIVKQQFFNVPAIGNNGGQHALGWYWDEAQSGISFYVSGHQNGELWSVGKNQYKNFKENHEAKKRGGKLLDNFLVSNAYESHIFLNVWELKLGKDLQTKGEKQYTFRRSGITSDTVLHFAKFGNIVSLDSRGSDGKLEGREETTNFSLTEFNKLFSNVPDIGDTLAIYREVNQKGEGSLGLKNISPWLTSTAAIYKYDHAKGLLTENTKDFIADFKTIEALKNAVYVDESFNYTDKNFLHAWFVYDAQEKKDRRKYKLVTFNAAGKVIASSDHVNETSKRPIVLNFPVYTNKLEAIGLVSVFGHDGDAPKELEGEDVTVFDVVYTDIKGKVLWKATFNHGDEKKYKNVVTPLRVFAEGDKLIFLNYKMESLFKVSYEVFSIDNKGNKQSPRHATTVAARESATRPSPAIFQAPRSEKNGRTRKPPASEPTIAPKVLAACPTPICKPSRSVPRPKSPINSGNWNPASSEAGKTVTPASAAQPPTFQANPRQSRAHQERDRRQPVAQREGSRQRQQFQGTDHRQRPRRRPPERGQQSVIFRGFCFILFFFCVYFG